MKYSDFPFDDSFPTFPNAEQMLKYFGAYADENGLREHIRFGQRVSNASPLSDGGWRIELENGGVREYSALIVATGQYAKPKSPAETTPGVFAGAQLHVFDYLDPTTPVDCRGKRVVVVGLGSSAAEVAAELAENDAAERVFLSARSGRYVLPKLIDGKPMDSKAPLPSDPLPAPLSALPLNAGVWLARRLLKRVFLKLQKQAGSFESLGLPVPDIEPWADRPTMSLEFIPALREGRIHVKPGISEFEGNRVLFTDGTSVEAEVIIYATGYQLDFPFFDRDTLGCDAPDLQLYQRIAHPQQCNLFFVGCCRVLCSMWPVAEQQSRWIARLLSGSFELPSTATRQRRSTPLARSLPEICNFYVEELRREAGGL